MSSNILPWVCPPGFHAQQLREAAKSLRRYAEFNRTAGAKVLAEIQETQADECDAKAARLEGSQ